MVFLYLLLLQNFPLIRRVRGNTIDEITRNIVLFPEHMCIWCNDDCGISNRISEQRRKNDHILDILRIKYSRKGCYKRKPSYYVII